MIQALYVALLEAGVDEDKARRAAEAIDTRDVARSITERLELNVRLTRAAYRRSGWIMAVQIVIVTLQMFNIASDWWLLPR